MYLSDERPVEGEGRNRAATRLAHAVEPGGGGSAADLLAARARHRQCGRGRNKKLQRGAARRGIMSYIPTIVSISFVL